MIFARWPSLIFLSLLSLVPFTLNADPGVEGDGDEMHDEYDVQSPEEIARAHQKIREDFGNAFQEPFLPKDDNKGKVFDKYPTLDPNHEVPRDLLETTLVYFDANKDKFPNPNFITVVDFKPRSDKYRFYLIDMASGAVEKYHTTHGIHSDPKKTGYATEFGNGLNSGRTSLGFVRTAEVYDGKFKRSVRLDGLSSTNSNMRDRAVVFHGWDKVHEADVIQGLSWGCITLDWSIKDSVLDKVKEGSLIYVGQSSGK